MNNTITKSNHKYPIGIKVFPKTKTSRNRSFTESSVYYKMLEMKQDFLFITGYDEESFSKKGEPTYWLNVNPDYIGGDSFSESDFDIINN